MDSCFHGPLEVNLALSLDVYRRPSKVSEDMYINLKFAVSGDSNLECIIKYQYKSVLSISLYLNVNSGVNPTRMSIFESQSSLSLSVSLNISL